MPESEDMLREIFQRQSQLNDEIFKKQDLRDRDGKVLTMAAIREGLEREELGPNGLVNQWLRNYLTALKAEADEVEQDLLWKWWSKDRIDLQNIRVEIVDLMHFLTSLALVSGLSPEDFHRLYTKKHEVNRNRQDQGYSKDTKNEADNKSVR
ncbi:MAG: hypothetical protein AMXMBFR7_39990 [Planctomycetota bacterium]